MLLPLLHYGHEERAIRSSLANIIIDMLRTRNKKILKKKKSIKESDSRWCDRLISIFNVSKGIEGIYKEEEEGDEKFSSFNHSRLLCPDVEKSF